MIPGEIISFITFPGVIVHEVSHKFFCDYYNVPVYEVEYFRPFSSIAGCVHHESTKEIKKQFFIGFGPLIINSLICALLLFPFCIPVMLSTAFLSYATPFSIFIHNLLVWIGFSIGVHAIPSNKDIEPIRESLDDLPLLIHGILTLFIFFVFFMNLKYVGFWLRIGYAVLISYCFSSLLFKVLC